MNREQVKAAIEKVKNHFVGTVHKEAEEPLSFEAAANEDGSVVQVEVPLHGGCSRWFYFFPLEDSIQEYCPA